MPPTASSSRTTLVDRPPCVKGPPNTVWCSDKILAATATLHPDTARPVILPSLTLLECIKSGSPDLNPIKHLKHVMHRLHSLPPHCATEIPDPCGRASVASSGLCQNVIGSPFRHTAEPHYEFKLSSAFYVKFSPAWYCFCKRSRRRKGRWSLEGGFHQRVPPCQTKAVECRIRSGSVASQPAALHLAHANTSGTEQQRGGGAFCPELSLLVVSPLPSHSPLLISTNYSLFPRTPPPQTLYSCPPSLPPLFSLTL